MTGIATLAQRLLELTRDGEIDWEASGNRKAGRFIFSVVDASVVLELVPGKEDNRDRIRISVLNSDGDSVDEMEVYRRALAPRSSTIGVNITAALFEDPNEKLMNALYGAVRRKVMRADEVIGGLLDNLSSEGSDEEVEE